MSELKLRIKKCLALTRLPLILAKTCSHISYQLLMIFWHIIPNRYTSQKVYFYLTTGIHVSGVTITHLQEHKTTVTTASCNRTRTPPTTHSNRFQLFHDNSGQQYGVTVTRCCSYSCFVLLKMGDSDTRNT